MRDEECVQFLQSVLPRLHLRWPGFRKVRAQVCKRLQRRIQQLALAGIADYQRYLTEHSDEWQLLDSLCRVSISRFYRDKQMFAFLEQEVLPTLAQRAVARGNDCLSIWSVGAGAGEEPYTIAIIWQLQLQQQFPQLGLQIIATDSDPNLIVRSEAACYDYSSVKNLPAQWRHKAFDLQDGRYCLKRQFKAAVQFRLHDLRQDFSCLLSTGIVDLLLCRNLAFTYFDEPLQQQTCARLWQVLKPGGALVIGIHEQLPPNAVGFNSWSERLRVFAKTNSQ
jgi:chemotaxis protein methyltransferase CheR